MAVIKSPTKATQRPTNSRALGPTRSPHAELVALGAKWLRTQCRCSTVLSELRAFTPTGECPDVVGWRSDYSILVECKTSRGDFKADRKKPFRQNPSKGIGAFRFYLCPPGIIQPEDLPDHWGLLIAQGRRTRMVVGPTGNIWESTINQAFRHQRNEEAEIAMLVSALRRQR